MGGIFLVSFSMELGEAVQERGTLAVCVVRVSMVKAPAREPLVATSFVEVCSTVISVREGSEPLLGVGERKGGTLEVPELSSGARLSRLSYES